MHSPAQTAATIISWRTKKTPSGFEYAVYSFSHQGPQVSLRTGVYPNRERATYWAKRWTRYFKSLARSQVAA